MTTDQTATHMPRSRGEVGHAITPKRNGAILWGDVGERGRGIDRGTVFARVQSQTAMIPEGFPGDSIDLLHMGGSEPIRVLLVDDDPSMLDGLRVRLTAAGCLVDTAAHATEAARILASHTRYDVIVTDAGERSAVVEVLRDARKRDADVQMIMMTGMPGIDSAVRSIELKAFSYLTKPFAAGELEGAVIEAAAFHHEQRARRLAMERLLSESASRRTLRASLAHALDTLFLEYQPIVSWSKRSVFAYEALLRTRDDAIPDPPTVLAAAERLGAMPFVSRAVRRQVADDLLRHSAASIFLNLHPTDLLDESLFDESGLLSRWAKQIVLEITERATLHDVSDLRPRIDRLRRLGYRIAIDDLGEGYAGLTSIAVIEPEIMKLDMSIVRGIERSPASQRLIRSMNAVAREAGANLIAEGVETAAERDALVELGCDYFQGYLFARPGSFPEVVWSRHER